MMRYMTHPEHGAMHFDGGDAIRSAQNAGWVFAKEPTADEVRAAKARSQAAVLMAQAQEAQRIADSAGGGVAQTREQMEEAYREKFGKAPHPNTSDERLAARLAEE